jgi:hypothetical protein
VRQDFGVSMARRSSLSRSYWRVNQFVLLFYYDGSLNRSILASGRAPGCRWMTSTRSARCSPTIHVIRCSKDATKFFARVTNKRKGHADMRCAVTTQDVPRRDTGPSVARETDSFQP